jgi:hypothetical protein
MSFVISRSVAEWSVRIAAPIALAFAGTGLIDIITLPQPSSSEFYSQVASSALQGTAAPRKDKSAAVTGFLKIMLGLGAIAPLVMMQRKLDATRIKLATSDRPFELVARTFPEGEHGKGEDKEQAPRHKTEEYQAMVAPLVRDVVPMVKENDWVQCLMGNSTTIAYGLGGTGKSRRISAIAMLKAVFQASRNNGVDTMILDPQLEANQFAATWASGELYDIDSIPDTQEIVLRSKACARHLITVFDEVSTWMTDYGLKDYMNAAIVHAGVAVRKTNQSHLFVCQQLEDFGKSEAVSLLFDTAEIIYFIPEDSDELGNLPVSKIVAIKKRGVKFSPYKPGNTAWALHNVPDDLDPSAFERRIGQDLAELSMGAVLGSSVAAPKAVPASTNGHNKEVAISDFR